MATPEQRRLASQKAIQTRWRNATPEQRAMNGRQFNKLPPEALSARNRANVLKRHAREALAKAQAAALLNESPEQGVTG